MTDTDDFVDLSTLERPKVQRFYGHWVDVSEEFWGTGEAMKHDNVNHPSHYGQGQIEAIEYIQDFQTHEEYVGYLRGNIAKYLHRWRYKNGIEDLKKARWYLDRLIELEES